MGGDLVSAARRGWLGSVMLFWTPIFVIIALAVSLAGAIALNSVAFLVLFFAALIADFVLGIIGVINLVLSTRDLSQIYNEPGIWRYMRRFFALYIAGLILTQIASALAPNPIAARGSVFLFIILNIPAAYSLRDAFKLLNKLTGITEFEDAGRDYWLGAWLSLILVGAFVIWYSYYVMIKAFGKLRAQAR